MRSANVAAAVRKVRPGVFVVRELRPGVLTDGAGVVTYRPELDDV